MHWSNAPGAGFTTMTGVEPWLPFGDFERCNVADQRADRGSVLHLVRDLIALRRALPALTTGAYESVATDDASIGRRRKRRLVRRRTSTPPDAGLWAWRRGEDVVVAVNLADEVASLDGVRGTVRISTDRARDGETVDGTLRLDAWHGVVVA